VAQQGACDALCRQLEAVFPQVPCVALHGGMQQTDRSRAIQRFKSGHARVLVATDVAARGLHVSDISHVICFDASKDKDTHVHRVGRTGRTGGVQGRCFALVPDADPQFAAVVAETMLEGGLTVPPWLWRLASTNHAFRNLHRHLPHHQHQPPQQQQQQMKGPLKFGLFVQGGMLAGDGAHRGGGSGDNSSGSRSRDQDGRGEVALSREELNALVFTESVLAQHQPQQHPPQKHQPQQPLPQQPLPQQHLPHHQQFAERDTEPAARRQRRWDQAPGPPDLILDGGAFEQAPTDGHSH
jgi:superfamily II DNA/RNA helicase